MSLFKKKGRSIDLDQAEQALEGFKKLELIGSGDPHEEFGKIRRFIEMLHHLEPDFLIFDGDYLAEPAYIKANKEFAGIAQQSTQILVKIFEELLKAKPKALCASGNYEILGTAHDAIEKIGSDQLFDIGCNKKLESRVDRVHHEEVYLDLDTRRITWPGNFIESDIFTIVGVEGCNPINSTFPGERTEENLQWALETGMAQKSSLPEDTILVVHCPPFGIRDRLGRFGVPPNLWGAHKGSSALRTIQDNVRPFLSLVGHIHEDFGVTVRSWPKGSDIEAEPKIDERTFKNRTKLLIGYDSSKTTLSITLNKGTLEYWNWSRIRIAQKDTLRLIDIEGEWMTRKGDRKPFKKYNHFMEFDDAISSFSE